MVDLANHVKDLSGLVSVDLYALVVFEEAEGWLNNGGDTIYLKDPTGKIVDSHVYSSASDNISIGRGYDGASDWVTCATVSKGTSNNGVCQ